MLQAKQREKGKLLLGVVGVKTSKGLDKKMVATGIHVRKKEKNSRVKAASISISQLFQDSSRKRKLKKALSKKKRNPEVSVLRDRKSKKGNKSSFLGSQKKAMTNIVQAQSILKQQLKAGFTLLDNTDVRCKSNSPCKPKHVTFSDVNNRFGWTADNMEQPQSVQTSEQTSQEGHNHHNLEPQLVYQRGDATSGALDEDTNSLSENVVSTGACCTIQLTKPQEMTILGNSEDLNHCIEFSNRSNCLNSIGLACLSSKVPSQNFDGVYSLLDDDGGLNVDVECHGEENHMVQLGSFNHVSLAVEAISGDLNRSPLSQHSSSCLDNRSRSTLQERFATNCHMGKVCPKPLGTCKGTVSSISSSTESNKSGNAQARDCVSACRNMYFGDDYVGLPINSRGEFVKVHPGGTPNSVDVFKRQCLGENSLCPSAFPTFFTPRTCTNHVNLRPNHHVPQISTVDQSVLHPGSRFTPKAPTAYGMDFSQLPSSERMKTHTYTIPSNKYPCTNQQVLSMECFCPGCMGHHNPQQKLLGMQSCFLSLNCEQNTQPTAETTMRLMGKTVTPGTSGIQCRGLNSEIPCSSKQSQAEDHSFQGPLTKAFPQLFHGGLVDPSSAFRISDEEREPSENPSYFAFVPAAELRSGLDTNSFRASGHSQQPELAAANNMYVQPLSCCNEGGQGHQQPVMANQVQSNAEDMLLGSMHCRHAQSVAAAPSFDRRSYFRNIVEKRPAPCQSTYPTQQFSNMTQRNPMSHLQSGYDIQSTGLTTQTKFTSLPPLPPSVIPSHVYSADYAQPHGSTTTFHPSIPVSYAVNKSNAPGNTIFQDESMEWTMIGSKLEGLERMKRNCKRPAENDGVFLTLPKKQCIAAVQRDLIRLPLREKGMEICQPRPDAQLLDMHVGFSSEPEADLQLGNKESHTTWSDHVHMVRSVKLKSGTKHILQPSGSSRGQGNSWPVHSVTPFAVENGAVRQRLEPQKSMTSNQSWL